VDANPRHGYPREHDQNHDGTPTPGSIASPASSLAAEIRETLGADIGLIPHLGPAIGAIGDIAAKLAEVVVTRAFISNGSHGRTYLGGWSPVRYRRMPPTPSTMVPIGTKAPDFDLPDVRGGRVSLASLADAKALLVMFICNHCPFVKHIREELAKLPRDYASMGLSVVAICSNDPLKYPQDNFDAMKAEALDAGWTFPYLHDPDQSVARAYRAACTPDFFLFDHRQTLVYRGQLDDSRPSNGIPVTGRDLRAAIDAALRGQPAAVVQVPSIGCNIKWIPGREPEYASNR
jgi:peroxiredoxin